MTHFRLTAHTEDEIRCFISKQKDSGFSYPEVGASATTAPSGYNIDHNRIQLGRGEATWQRAEEAIRAWKMFSKPWVNLHWPSAPILVGTEVAVSIHHFVFYSLNACRIVYVVDEDGLMKRFGFAYGTLAEHAETGEERFTVEWNQANNEVCYDILAFSRPRKGDGETGLSTLAVPPEEICRGIKGRDVAIRSWVVKKLRYHS